MSARPAILTVDDEPDVLRAVARDLRKRYGKDYRIMRADSGTEAADVLRELKERGEPVALVLSDQRMPRMDGVALLGEAMALHPGARRALLTAYADTDAAIAAINRSQVDYYLMKPWDPPEERLFPIVDDLLESWRRAWKPGYGGIRLLGHRWSPESHQLRDFLARNHIPYTFLDVERDPDAIRMLELMDTATRDQLPIALLADGERLLEPTPADLARQLGLKMSAAKPFYDLAIVGAGPAGLASAVYGASEGLKTVLIEREAPGGQAGTSSRIENYLGFPKGLSGGDLAQRAVAQARRFGVEILTPADVTGLSLEGPYKVLTLANGDTVTSHALMLSTGVSWRTLPSPGALELTGRGVYYGAAITEAIGCKDQDVYIIGAGNSAGQAAMYFAEYARRVIMLVRGDSLASKMSHYLVERIDAHPTIDVELHTEVAECHGTERLDRLTLRDRRTQECRQVDAPYLFVFIGAAPRTDWLGDTVARDDAGFVLTGPALTDEQLRDWPLERPPYLLETNVPGVFAAGDVRADSVKRVASAVGEGSVSVYFMHRHLSTL